MNLSGQIAAWDLVANKSLGKAKIRQAARSLDTSSDALTARTWVACYGGSVKVFANE